MGHFEGKFIAVMLCAVIVCVSTYPNAVPNSPDVCSKMTPGHGPRPQLTPAPYKIILNKQQMHGGNNLQIVLEGKKGQKFRGFYMQVRDQDGSPIGTFLIPDDTNIGAHNCFNLKHNAIHHKNRNDKESITVYWKAPETFDGKVRVLATVLQDFETYWVNVKAPELVSVSNTTHYFTSSSDFLEKGKTESTKGSKANRILNYNPYSPYSPLLSAWDNDDHNSIQNLLSSSKELLLTQASEDSTVTAQQRQLFGFPSFDFHGTRFSPKLTPPRKSKNVFIPRPEHSQSPFPEHDDDKHLPLFRPGLHHHHPNSDVDAPKGSLFYNKLAAADHDVHDKNIFNSHKGSLPFSYPPQLDNSYYHHQSSAPIFPTESYDKLPPYPPHLSQSVHNDKGSHYFINHHYDEQSSPFQSNYPKPKPASDPAYPHSQIGYRPKDLLTRLTSYLPNIYNALTNNPLFNFNIDNTIESVWKPTKGIPTKYDLPLVSSSSTTATKMQMPKYGYLVYNPVRKNPYFVIPAENEEEFVANHFGRRKGVVS